MKVRVTVTLDIDPEAYAMVYGVEPAEVREDARTWAQHTLTEHARDVGILTERTER